jgi:hypothetical protein
VRGHDRRHWGPRINEQWIWTFPILFPLACIVGVPVAIGYSLWMLGRRLWEGV